MSWIVCNAATPSTDKLLIAANRLNEIVQLNVKRILGMAQVADKPRP